MMTIARRSEPPLGSDRQPRQASGTSIGFHAASGGLYTAPMEDNTQTMSGMRARPADDAGLEALLAVIAQRDEAAFARFYDATSARAYGLILRITRVVALAEEVMADVYLQVWQQAQRFDPTRGNALAWLFMLCRSRALDQLRRREPAESHADPECLCDEAASDGGPLDLLMALDRASAIHAAVAQLGEMERQLLALAFFRGLSHQEIANHTGMPLGSVKTLLRKAMHTLKVRLIHFAPLPEGLS